MTAGDAAELLRSMAEGCTPSAVGVAIEQEATALLPALAAATPVGTGYMARAWRVLPGASADSRILTNAAVYSGLVRERGARVLPEGHSPSRPGWHWDRPPVYLAFMPPVLGQLEQRLAARIRNITAPYIPVLEDY